MEVNKHRSCFDWVGGLVCIFMADDITNIVLLEHMQAMKNDLQQQIAALDRKLDQKIAGVEKNMANLSAKMGEGFEEARQHRQALQEDLEETMRKLSKHEAKLARL